MAMKQWKYVCDHWETPDDSHIYARFVGGRGPWACLNPVPRTLVFRLFGPDMEFVGQYASFAEAESAEAKSA